MLIERLKLWTGITAVEEDGRQTNLVLERAIGASRTALMELAEQSKRLAHMAARTAILEDRMQETNELNIMRGEN